MSDFNSMALPELRALAVAKAKTEGIPTTAILQGTQGWNKAKLVAFLKPSTTTGQQHAEPDQIHDVDVAQIAEDVSLPEVDQAAAAARTLATPGCGDQANASSTSSPGTTFTTQSSVGKDDPFISAADILLLPDEKETILGGIIEAETTGQLFGPSGGGKTFVALDMALSIASGTEWNGSKCDQGMVLYFAGEGHNGLRRRIKAWHLEHGKPDISHCYITRQAVPFDETGLTPSGLKAIELARQSGLKVSFIVCDTLARHILGDENSTQNMSEFVNVVDRLRKVFPGSSALIVHHTGNDADKSWRSRGSSALKAACDFEILCNKGSLTYTKLKDGEPPPPQEFKLVQVEVGIDKNGDPITSCVVMYGETPVKKKEMALTAGERELLELVQSYPGILPSDLRKTLFGKRKQLQTDVKYDTVKKSFTRSLNGLIEKKMVYMDGSIVKEGQGTFEGHSGDMSPQVWGQTGTSSLRDVPMSPPAECPEIILLDESDFVP